MVDRKIQILCQVSYLRHTILECNPQDPGRMERNPRFLLLRHADDLRQRGLHHLPDVGHSAGVWGLRHHGRLQHGV